MDPMAPLNTSMALLSYRQSLVLTGGKGNVALET